MRLQNQRSSHPPQLGKIRKYMPAPETPAAPAAAPAMLQGKWLRYRRLPTWRLWLLLITVVGGGLGWLASQTHDWLSQNAPLERPKYYLAEGWLPDYAVGEAGRLFTEDKSNIILTSGGPLDRGSMLSSYKDFANVAASTLAATGVNPMRILPAPCAKPRRERTRVMAEAVKAQLDGLSVPPEDKTLNIVSLGVHSRRSLAVYRDVLGPEWKVGVVCVPDMDYPADQWYRTSAGARSSLTELVALLVNQQ
jgi:hypothetical protein